MLILKGKSLGERQKELNLKVNDAAANKIPFEQIKDDAEGSDIDRFFKIDLASQYRNIYYMLDVLKCGDSLYISRALKCLWMYEDEYAYFINEVYLHEHVFPFMSFKMKRKTLSTIATHVRNEIRALTFYEYCLKIKLKNIAYKFFVHTSEEVKLSVHKDRILYEGPRNMKHIVGNSFVLAKDYLDNTAAFKVSDLLHELHHLYSISSKKYLDLIEKYYTSSKRRFSVNMSVDIAKKHKARILKNLSLYFSVLDLNGLIKCSTQDDIKLYLSKMIPKYVDQFWEEDFFYTHKRFIDVFPIEDRFLILKKLFTDTYPGEEFEMSLKFYQSDYEKFMTPAQQEDWALQHLSTNKELLGTGQDYYWYSYINFQKAFQDVKMYYLTDYYRSKRSIIFNILISRAKYERDLETLMRYYYEQHIKENKSEKELFLHNVTVSHNVLTFEDTCWAVFEKIVYSIDGYNNSDEYSKPKYKIIGLIYHIIHDNDLPQVLEQYIDLGINFELLKLYTSKLDAYRKEKVYLHLLHFYIDLMKKNKGVFENDGINSMVRKYDILKILELLDFDSKSKEEKLGYFYPETEIAMKFIGAEENEERLTQEHLIRILKKDASILVEKLPLLKKKMYVNKTFKFRLTKFLSKLKIYFSDDIAMKYLELFKEMLLTDVVDAKAVYETVNGIFTLADQEFINDLMIKYAPEEEQIVPDDNNSNLSFIRKSICRVSCRSRPAVPIKNFLSYVVGQYEVFCIPAIDTFVSNLPLYMCLQLIKELLKKSLPVKKHAVRLAVKCYNDTLKSDEILNLGLDIWHNPNKKPLRVPFYRTLFNLVKVDKAEDEVVHLLNVFTSYLDHKDDDKIFILLKERKFCYQHVGIYIANAWLCVRKLPDDDKNARRKRYVVQAFKDYFVFALQKITRAIAIDEHIKSMLVEKQILNKSQSAEVEKLNSIKLELLARYVIRYEEKDIFEDSLQLIGFIMDICKEMWDEGHDDVYALRKLCFQLVANLQKENYYYICQNYKNVNKIFNVILDEMIRTPTHETFFLFWSIRLTIETNKIIDKARNNKNKCVFYKYGVKFGKEISELVYCMKIYRYRYINILLNKMVIELEKHIERIFANLEDYCTCGTKIEHLNVLVASGLLHYEKLETYLLAVMILPNKVPNRHKNIFYKVIKDVQKAGKMPIQCHLNEKYVNHDFKKLDVELNGRIKEKWRWTTNKVLVFIFVTCFIYYLHLKFNLNY